MSKAFEMFSSSIGRKFVMSLTGLFLITYLVIHLAINLLSLVDAHLFNEASHFMGTNWFIQAMQYVLALGFIFHIVQGIALARSNAKARPQKYALDKPSTNSSFSSRSMIITGLLVLLFLVLHLRDYFWELKFDDMNGHATDFDLVVALFANPLYTGLYVFSFIMLGIHLNHGFQSAFQSVGVNHPKYTPGIKKFGVIYCVIVSAGFSLIALVHYFNSL